ncbi:hypothetical protein Bbelb_396920 [Branchiostoma belcheri]|nr:hypothetical protein Bbelb_396920 [Branchiostoma belcheri]
MRAFCPYVFWEATSATFFLKTWGRSGVDARHSHGCARCKSGVCTPRLAVSGCVHRSLRKWKPYSHVLLTYGSYGARASSVLACTGGESTDRTRRDLIVRTPRGTPPVAGIPPGHISYVTDQMNRIKPMPARLLNPAGASRGYIPDGHRRNWDLSLRRVVTEALLASSDPGRTARPEAKASVTTRRQRDRNIHHECKTHAGQTPCGSIELISYHRWTLILS